MKIIFCSFVIIICFQSVSQNNTIMIDSLANQLIKSGFIDSETYKEETDLLLKFYINVKEILNIPNESLENSILSLKSEVAFQIDGKRYKHKDIKEVIDMVNPVLEGILNKTYNEQEGINLINQKIVLLRSMTKPDINPLLKAEVADTGYINLTPEQISEFQDWLMQPIEEFPPNSNQPNDELENDEINLNFNETVTEPKKKSKKQRKKSKKRN